MYQLNYDQEIVIVALPAENAQYTLIDFQYSAEGEEYSDLEKWYFQTFTQNEPETQYFYLVILAIVLLSLICLACCLFLSCKLMQACSTPAYGGNFKNGEGAVDHSYGSHNHSGAVLTHHPQQIGSAKHRRSSGKVIPTIGSEHGVFDT